MFSLFFRHQYLYLKSIYKKNIFLMKLFSYGNVAPTAVVLFFLTWGMPLLHAQLIDNPNRYFSPNLDGSKDALPVPLIIKENKLDKWSVDIFKREGSEYRTIKHFESLNTREVKNLTARKFFSRIFERDSSVDVPSLVSWSGEDESGILQKDGEYYLSIYARDRSGNESRTALIPIFLDTITPISTAVLQDTIFSPNEDGKKETLDVKISSINFEALDKRIVEVLDENGTVVYSEQSRTPDELWQWDGKNGEDEIPEGRYLLRVRAEDYAGNESVSQQESFTLVRTYEALKFSVEPLVFSPNKDAAFDDALFSIELSSTNGLEEWQIDILGEKNDVLKRFSGVQLPNNVVFDGMGNNNQIVEDQNLKVVFSSKFRSGNMPSSKQIPLKLDTTPPKVSVDSDTEVFNPTASSGARSMDAIQTAIAEPADVFLGTVEDEEGRVVFETNFKSKLPSEFSWDGKNSFGKRVPGLYKYVLMGKDAVANSAMVATKPVRMVLGEIDGRLSSSRLAFSPNDDDVKDRTVFLLKFEGEYENLLSKGTIVISKDPTGKRVLKSFPMQKFVGEIPWLGDDKNGKMLADGEYFYSGDFVFSTGEKISFAAQPIYIDRKPVAGVVVAKTSAFSPNNDGRVDEYAVQNTFGRSEVLPDYDNFLVRIENEAGKLVRENSWKKNLPKTIKWNGRGENGNLVEEGIYTYKVFTEDEAGNRKVYDTMPLRLSLTVPDLSLKVSSAVVSGRREAVLTNIDLLASTANSVGIDGLVYEVVNDVGDVFVIQEYAKNPSKKQLKINEGALSSFAWNVVAYEKGKAKEKSNAKKNFYLASGNYIVRAIATYASGLISKSPGVPLTIDNENPENGVASRPRYFSPDNDGENETLSLRFIASDNDTLVSNSAKLYRRVEFDSRGKKFKQTFSNYQANFPVFKNFSIPNQKTVDLLKEWDGVGEDGSLVESANDYVIFFNSTDRVGLSKQSVLPILVDIYIIKLPDGRLKIVINSIHFKFDSDKMVGDYQSVLERLVRMLNKFPKYEILIVGHTDSRGEDSYNEKLSLRRAKRVHSFLTKTAGIPKKQVSFEGRGESELFIVEEKVLDPALSDEEREYLTEENYRKNRRVEFFLENKEK